MDGSFLSEWMSCSCHGRLSLTHGCTVPVRGAVCVLPVANTTGRYQLLKALTQTICKGQLPKANTKSVCKGHLFHAHVIHDLSTCTCACMNICMCACMSVSLGICAQTTVPRRTFEHLQSAAILASGTCSCIVELSGTVARGICQRQLPRWIPKDICRKPLPW